MQINGVLGTDACVESPRIVFDGQFMARAQGAGLADQSQAFLTYGLSLSTAVRRHRLSGGLADLRIRT